MQERLSSITAYRVVRHDPPQPEDFASDVERKLVPHGHELPHYHEGLSVFDTLRDARGLAKWMKRRYGYDRLYIAAIDVVEGGPFGTHPDPPPSSHHCLWGDKEQLASAARTVDKV